MVAVSLAFMLVVLRTVIRHRRRLSLRLPIYGAGGTSRVPNGTPAEVRSPLDPTGTVFAAGEEWSATTAAARGGPAVGSATTSAPAPQPIPRGARVTVVGQQGLTLIVEPDPASGRVS
jgi:membrane-bound ClpP family serine protease